MDFKKPSTLPALGLLALDGESSRGSQSTVARHAGSACRHMIFQRTHALKLDFDGVALL